MAGVITLVCRGEFRALIFIAANACDESLSSVEVSLTVEPELTKDSRFGGRQFSVGGLALSRPARASLYREVATSLT